MYSCIRNKRVAGERIGPLKDKGGSSCMEPDEVGELCLSEVLNEYLATVSSH